MTAKADKPAADTAELSPEQIARVIEIDWGFMKSQAVFTWAKLGIADVLQDEAKTSAEIAAAVGAHEPSLQRLLQALSTIDIVTKDDDGRFRATALGAYFKTDHPESLRNWARDRGGPMTWLPWGELAQAIKTGRPSFEHVFGVPFFTYLAEHPEDAATFHAGASMNSRTNVPLILDAYDFSPFSTVVDVGGGHGALLRGILERHAAARGILCDLPGTVAEARELRDSPVSGRCEYVAADMFASVPAGGNAYVMKQVLHDFNDDEVVRVLTNIRRAIAADGKLVIVERLLDLRDKSNQTCWSDLNMLVLLTGRERTKDEFGELYRQAGFRLDRVMKTAGHLWVLEGAPC